MSEKSDPKRLLADGEIADSLRELPGWAHTEGALTWTGVCEDAESAIALFDRIAQAAQEANHHPDVLWSYNELTLDLSSHDVGGITPRDIALARRVCELAEAAGAKPLGQD